MRYRRLGSSNLKVSELCLGTMMFADQTDAKEAAAILAAASEQGVNFIDTADVYSKGACETMLGGLLAGQRNRWILASKVGNAMSDDPNHWGITEHGRVSKDKLDEISGSCDVWAYYCTFSESNCITAINAQKLGLVPITMKRAGLMDTVYSGILLDEDGDEPGTREKYLEQLVFAYENPEWLEKEKEKAKSGVDKFYWENIAKQWMTYIQN